VVSAREVVPSTIHVPEHKSLDESRFSSSSPSSTSSDVPKAEHLTALKKKRAEELAEELAKHEGYP
jgi:hypothetical protein